MQVQEAIKTASKSVQTLLECELRCETARDKARREREQSLNTRRQEFVAEINRKREEVSTRVATLEQSTVCYCQMKNDSSMTLAGMDIIGAD